MINFFFFGWGAACGILGLWPWIEASPPAVEAQSFNHWTAGEVPSDQLRIQRFFPITWGLLGETEARNSETFPKQEQLEKMKSRN